MSISFSDSNIVKLTKTKLYFPVSLYEAKRHLRVDESFNDDDDYINGLIETATALAENYTNKDIAKTENELFLYDYSGDYINILEGNFLSLISITDSNDASIGSVDKEIINQNGVEFYLTSSIASDPVKVKFYTGFDEDKCPKLIKQGILTKVADFYDTARSNFGWNGMTDNKVFETIMNHYVQMYV